jgi:hypothetical protein
MPPWEHPEDLIEIVLVDQTAPQCRVEGRQRGAGWLAPDRASDGVEQLDRGRLGVRGPMEAAPVSTHRTRGSGCRRASGVEMDMQRRLLEDEDAMLREDGDTGEPPTEGTCLDEVAGGVAGEIRARARPQKATIDHRRAEGSIRPALSTEISAPVEVGDPASSSGIDMIQHGLSLNRRHIASNRQAGVSE